jgi:thiosulfate/3-mercaptopyruvate sulfurtransferase
MEDVELQDLPPSCKFVYKEVWRHGEIHRQELIDETGLPERTIARALKRLQNGGYIDLDRDSDDLRQVVAKLASG